MVGTADRLTGDLGQRTRDTCGSRECVKDETLFHTAGRHGMSELKMSHWIFHAPFNFFETFIHLPWHGMKTG
jgi:hypothetical protein